MANYEVRIYETVYHTVEVEADNKDDAYTQAWSAIIDGPFDEYETNSDGFTGRFSIEEVK